MLELDGATLTYEQFRTQCLERNHPAIIRNAAAQPNTFQLPALMEQLSPSNLCELLGADHRVPVYPVHSINPATERGETCSEGFATRTDSGVSKNDYMEGEGYCCEERPLGEVLRSWSTDQGTQRKGDYLFYLKDWHMQSEVEAAVGRRGGHPLDSVPATPLAEDSVAMADQCGFNRGVTSARRHGHGLYQVPEYLGPDWMDPFCVDTLRAQSPRPPMDTENRGTNGNDTTGGSGSLTSSTPLVGFGGGTMDYRFAYMGAANTWTVLHHDVFGTYSWSFNVCGTKQWFFPDVAGNTYLHEHLVRGFPTPPDMRVMTGFTYWTCVQQPGDLVFVPSRYFHQVHNLSGHMFDGVGPWKQREGSQSSGGGSDLLSSDASTPCSMELTIAVNHNWCNQFCIERMVDTFLSDVRLLLDMVDVDDLRLLCGPDDPQAWRQHMDFMLQSGCNWGFASMLSFLRYCERVFGSDEDGRVGLLLRQLIGKVTEVWDNMFAA